MRNEWIVFVDTQIWFDLYRQQGGSAINLLDELTKYSSNLILTNQVRVEFLKNRQRVIIEAAKGIPRPRRESIPPVFQDIEHAEAMLTSLGNASSAYEGLKKNIVAMLSDPVGSDPVLQAFESLFAKSSSSNLRDAGDMRSEIHNRARLRFEAGRPPRKKDDTSIGDAINWEWVLHCADQRGGSVSVMIVSRDGDYGARYEKNIYMNDYLASELRSRVDRRGIIKISDKLSDALKILGVHLGPEAIRRQEELERTYMAKKAIHKRKMGGWNPTDEDEKIFFDELVQKTWWSGRAK